MGKQTITEAQRKDMRIMYVKGLLPCAKIAEKIGCTRQSVATILKKMGVDTRKQKIVFECSTCGKMEEKTRAEYRKHERHFCSSECYNESLRDPKVQVEAQAMKIARDKAMDYMPYGGYPDMGFYITSSDIYVFASREDMLTWKRTGLYEDVFSVKKGKMIRKRYNGKPMGGYPV